MDAMVNHCGLEKRRNRLVSSSERECAMNSIIYIIGLIVVVLAVLSLLGLR